MLNEEIEQKGQSFMKKRNAVLLAAGIPTVLLIANILFVLFALKYVNGFNEAQLDIKRDNFTAYNATSPSGQTVFLGDSITCLLYTSPSPRD